MKKRLFPILTAFTLLTLVASCLKDEGNGTIVMMGTESYWKPVEAVIPDTLLRFLDAKGCQYAKGYNPPNVQGEFELCPRELKWSNVDAVPAGDSLFFRFGGDMDYVIEEEDTLYYYPYGQHGRVTPCDYLETYFELTHADTVYLMGKGDSVTVYFAMTFPHINSAPGVDFDLTRGFMIMGKLPRTEKDTVKMHVACVNMKVKVNKNNPAVSGVSNALLENMEGRIYVYKGPVYKKQWYHQ